MRGCRACCVSFSELSFVFAEEIHVGCNNENVYLIKSEQFGGSTFPPRRASILVFVESY